MTDEQKNDLQEEQNTTIQQDEVSNVELLQKKCDEYLAGWQRAKADYSNLKKESEKRHDELLQFANAALLAELIPVYDNFKKAFEHQPKNQDKEWQNWQLGIGHIKKQMWDFIQKFGIEEIKTVGEMFDPHVHESVEKQKSEEFESGVVIKEVMPGYTLHGKLLTPAKVVVAE